MFKNKYFLSAIGFCGLSGAATGALVFHLFSAEEPTNLFGLLILAVGLVALAGTYYSFKRLRQHNSD